MRPTRLASQALGNLTDNNLTLPVSGWHGALRWFAGGFQPLTNELFVLLKGAQNRAPQGLIRGCVLRIHLDQAVLILSRTSACSAASRRRGKTPLVTPASFSQSANNLRHASCCGQFWPIIRIRRDMNGDPSVAHILDCSKKAVSILT